jgi:hypothetical protein
MKPSLPYISLTLSRPGEKRRKDCWSGVYLKA